MAGLTRGWCSAKRARPWYVPGVSNRTKSNKKSIELNRTIDVRLGSAIEQNRTSILLWVRFSNKIEPIRCNFVRTVFNLNLTWDWIITQTTCLSCEGKIVLLNKSSVIERLIEFDYVRLAKFYCEVDYVRLSSAIERLVFDWVRLPNCAIGYAGYVTLGNV